MHPVYSASEIQDAVETLRPFGSKPAWLTNEALRGIGEKAPTGTLSDEEDRRLASNLRNWRKSLHDQFHKASDVLYADLKNVNPDDFEDPDGVVFDSLYMGETQYETTLNELRAMHDSVFKGGTNSIRGGTTCQALADLIGLYEMIIGCIQEIRWSVQILEGLRDPVVGPPIKSGAEFISALDEPDPQ